MLMPTARLVWGEYRSILDIASSFSISWHPDWRCPWVLIHLHKSRLDIN
jgi:hypothetical protein